MSDSSLASEPISQPPAQCTASRRTAARSHHSHAEDLAELPPAFIVTAELDLLRDQGIRYADALRGAGVPVTHRAVEGVPHAFLPFTRDVRISRDVLDEIGDAIGAAFA
ncbi:alpha/beta hydrolase [Lentzea sp. CC55]|uniref:alpha/beta hydrolase n=1 Tax=Lentzea sp. CC55 TaxID=2884909 RepID=UPI001F3BD866|nr:alpha/beta hydrolase fold domain-containing protein [Lentzea sp. CC55]MCG8927739.1 alpha/beta hydrolase [Lentzea sp. CC55]